MMKRLDVPSIDWINANAGSNGRVCVSTFAGCGGSSTGYKWAGFKVPVAVEFVDKAAETYRANAPSTAVLEEDIRQISGEKILEMAGVDQGELDVLDGSPPCQAFSQSGLRDKGWGQEKQYSGSVYQRSDDLFFEFVRLIDETHPKVFVAENVNGLVAGVAKGYFAEFYKAFEAAGPGYRVEARRVEAVRLGVPQRRERIIFVGVRNDLRRDPVFPEPVFADGQHVSIQEAFEDLPEPERAQYDILREGTRTRMAWDYADVLEEDGCFRHAYVKLYGKEARYNWFKLPPHKPAPTIAAKVPSLFRWDVPRTLSIPEIVRASSFPDDFVLPGKFKHQWERIGRAVPPMMMMHIARTVDEKILKPRVKPHYRFIDGVWVKTN